jgi:hypothetical protein
VGQIVAWKVITGGKSYMLEQSGFRVDSQFAGMSTAVVVAQTHGFPGGAGSHTHQPQHPTSGETEWHQIGHIYKSERTGLWHYYLMGPYAEASELITKGCHKDIEIVRLSCLFALIFNHKAPSAITDQLKLDNPTKLAVLLSFAKEWGLYEDSIN